MHGDRGMRVPPQPMGAAVRIGASSTRRFLLPPHLASPRRSFSVWLRCSPDVEEPLPGKA